MSKILVIAECGINGGGIIEINKELILRAKDAGADVAKFQLYDVDALFPDKQIIAQNRNWYEEVKKTQLTKEQVFELAGYCREVGIEFFASAFDLERLSWLEEVGVKRHKIPNRYKSSSILNAMRRTGKQIIISTYPDDPFIEWEFWRGTCTAAHDYKFLYCVSNYPTELKDLHFAEIKFDSNHFNGLSDHTIGIETSIIAMARGATIIEKHFCLKRDNSNPDMVCSIEPNELKELVKFARKVEEVL